jgi:hypothetical protein
LIKLLRDTVAAYHEIYNFTIGKKMQENLRFFSFFSVQLFSVFFMTHSPKKTCTEFFLNNSPKKLVHLYYTILKSYIGKNTVKEPPPPSLAAKILLDGVTTHTVIIGYFLHATMSKMAYLQLLTAIYLEDIFLRNYIEIS